jgi:alpha-1,6-mannosyltransferase
LTDRFGLLSWTIVSATHPFVLCRRVGTVGSLLLGASGWAVGALPKSDPLGWWREHGHGVTVLGGTLAYVGMVLLVGAWWRLGRLVAGGARGSDDSRGAVAAGTRRIPRAQGNDSTVDAARMSRLLWWWAAPLAFGPPLFSSDVYSYVAQGAMSIRGLNVYHATPADLGGSLVGNIPVIWQHVTAPYGPVFIQLADTAVRLTGENVVPAVLAMRAIALASLAVIMWAVRSLAGAAGSRVSGALWAGALNPLVLVHLVAGAHNDALMLALMLAGLALARKGHAVYGVVAVSLAMLVKIPAGLALFFLAPLSREGGGRVWPGAWRAVAGLAVVAVVTVAVTTVTGLGYGWVLALRTPVSVETFWSFSTNVGRLLRWVAPELSSSGWASDVDPMALVRSVCMVVAVAANVYWIRNSPRAGPEVAFGMAMLSLVTLSPVVQPWYVLWATIPLAVTAWRPMAGFWPKAMVVVLVFTVLPEGTGPTTEIITSGLLGIVIGVALLALLFPKDREALDDINAGDVSLVLPKNPVYGAPRSDRKAPVGPEE